MIIGPTKDPLRTWADSILKILSFCHGVLRPDIIGTQDKLVVNKKG
jgi:hypothetical protein